MRTERVTVSLPAELVTEARNAVSAGQPGASRPTSPTVSARQLRDRSLAALADLYGGPPPTRRAGRGAADAAPGAAGSCCLMGAPHRSGALAGAA